MLINIALNPRLTALELKTLQIPSTMIVDTMVGSLFQHHKIHAVGTSRQPFAITLCFGYDNDVCTASCWRRPDSCKWSHGQQSKFHYSRTTHLIEHAQSQSRTA